VLGAKTPDRVCVKFMIFLPFFCRFVAQFTLRKRRSARGSVRGLSARLRTPICETLVSGPVLTSAYANARRAQSLRG
jgi:hypothetical protein